MGSRAVLAQGNIDPLNDGSHFAYGENVGWINFKPSFGPGVMVTDFAVTGFAWGENTGWINLSPATAGVLNDGAGNLSGFAWGENVGWISFSCTNTGSCASVDYGVTIDQGTGEFQGEAYGQNIGWIVFDPIGSVDFGVTTSGIPTDVFPPTTLASLPSGEWHTASVAVTLTAMDNVGGSGIQEIHHRVDGDPETVTPGANTVVNITTDGVHTLYFFAVDNEGNPGSEQMITIRIDTTPPEITIASPMNAVNYFINQSVLADYSASDALSGVASVTGTAANGSPIQTAPTGIHAFTVTATDIAGNSTSTGVAYTVIYSGNIDPTNSGAQFAWGENVGWINFQPSFGPGVTVSTTSVTGFAWGENIGWINLSSATPGVLNDGEGNLSGYAYAENVGWISFSCTNTETCATVDYGVKVDQATGEFIGKAYGENIGWIVFDSTGPVDFGVTTSGIPTDVFPPTTVASFPVAEWHTTSVMVTLTAMDNVGGSGVQEIHHRIDGDPEVVEPGAAAVVNVTTDGIHTVHFFAVDNMGNPEPEQAVLIRIDMTPPEITIASPANTASYFLNQNVPSGYSATDALSGVASVTGTVPNGSAIQTTPVGPQAFSVTATDIAGNSTSMGVAYTVIYSGNIDSTDVGSHFAWGENVGWINFRPSHGPGVTVTDSEVTGLAWGENIGWINLSPSGGGVFNDGEGNLTGFAYGENVGWISFSCENTSSCSTADYSVKVDPETGSFSGHAWGENIGWIRFLETAPPADGVTTSWRPGTAVVTATRRVSVDSFGNEGMGPQGSSSPSISANGRFVAFQSRHTNLVPVDTNNIWDVLVHDRDVDGDGIFDEPGEISTAMVSLSSSGLQGNFESRVPSISADGRFVAFSSISNNLVSGDSNGRFDVFVRDRDADGNGTFDEPGGVATTRVSVSGSGTQGNFSSDDPRISADGRFVCFRSEANNLVPGDTNGAEDAFVHDRQTGATTRVSVPNLTDQGTLGAQANSYSSCQGISGDGRFVALLSGASNLVLSDTNGVQDLFVHDRQTGATTRVSVPNLADQGSLGSEAGDHIFFGAISVNGRVVAFDSSASNLVVGDTNGSQDVFVHDLDTGVTTRASVDSDGNQGGSFSSFPSLSADGRFVAFQSFADNLVPDDTNFTGDIFVYDLQSGATTRVSIPNTDDQATLGTEANSISQGAVMSADGHSVAFSSVANNLVLNDTNASTGEEDVFVHDRGN